MSSRPPRPASIRSSSLRLALALSVLGVLLTGCDSDERDRVVGGRETTARILATSPSPRVGLATVVSFETSLADSARVRAVAPDGETFRTPYVPVGSGRTSVSVLGLRAGVTYTHTLEVRGHTGALEVPAGEAATDTLPTALAEVALRIDAGPGPSGHLFTGLRDGHLVAFDETGRLIWYHRVEGFLGRFVDVAPNGNFLVFVGTSRGWEPTFGYYLEITPDGETVARYQAGAPFYTDNHELLLTEDDEGGLTAHLFGYTLRPVDMQAIFPPDGNPDAIVAGHQLLRYAPDGRLDFFFDAWDHLEVADWEVAVPAPEDCGTCDFDHPNALDLDADGHYVVSFRTLNEITGIDANTGAIRWRLGGANDQFSYVDDPLGGFSGQHAARAVGDGHVLLFDNGPNHDPTLSRGVEYALDHDAGTATLVWEYRPEPSLYSAFQCYVQRLDDGNTLVGFSAQAEVHVADPDGNAVWKGTVEAPDGNGRFYRIHAIGSIYDPRK